MRVFLFDPYPVVQRALESFLPDNGLQLAGSSAVLDDCEDELNRARADVIVSDVMLKDGDVFKLLQMAHLPGLPIVIYSDRDNPTYVARAIALGARDFVPKWEPMRGLVDSLKRIESGNPPAKDSLFGSVTDNLRQTKIRNVPNPHGLTAREIQVLRHLAYGLSNREIALSLEVSVETIKEHVQNILRKQDATDRTAAAVWAVRHGFV